ncbi:hypothetical protein D0851_09510 [Marinobacter sp. Arc7-DN-1]|nr:hypothetical protein D0851_09505 [Marinobacter sp. Arc7-DN-1]AXS83255.1 hypothetical protein D0851_09510 [Marinobacter sp. Arc7-DN-1]
MICHRWGYLGRAGCPPCLPPAEARQRLGVFQAGPLLAVPPPAVALVRGIGLLLPLLTFRHGIKPPACPPA